MTAYFILVSLIMWGLPSTAPWAEDLPVKATLTSPEPGSTLDGSSVTFTWEPGRGVTQYHLYVGQSVGGLDLYHQAQGTSLSVTVTGLPTDGHVVYVRLWSQLAWTAWEFNDYTYTTASGTVAITSPEPRSTLTGSAVIFTWEPGSGVTQYWPYIGRSQGAADLYHQAQGTNLLASVTGLPTDGSTVYVRLWSQSAWTWVFNDYTYRAASWSAGRGATMTSPEPGSQLTGSAVTFTWESGSGVLQYHLQVGRRVGGLDLYQQAQGTNLSATVTGLPTDGRLIYVRLFSQIALTYEWVFNDYVYTAR